MKLDLNRASGSQIRPLKILQAFKNLNYEVDIVMGDVKERKNQIKQIKENILNGMKYDFLYSESSTMPTALTENHHLPIAPFFDFDFFRFCKQHGIKIGLFYRDIFWRFKSPPFGMTYFKFKFSLFFYKYDLEQYKKYVDILYLPSLEMFPHLKIDFPGEVKALPPACEERVDISVKTKKDKLSFIYVGGVSHLYDLTLFSEVVTNIENVTFNLCTREDDWHKEKYKYKDMKNLKIHHLKGSELNALYSMSDIAIYFIKPNIIWDFAMGLKLFEYISFLKPIIAIKGTSVGDFIEQYNIGWCVEYDKEKLYDLINHIKENPAVLGEKIKNIKRSISLNTWNARIEEIINNMKGKK